MKKVICFLAVLITFVAAFQLFRQKEGVENESYTINLRHNKSYHDETDELIYKGLLWSFSQVGATLPKKTTARGIEKVTDTLWRIDVSKLGFRPVVLEKWRRIIAAAKNTQEYHLYGSIMLNRFVICSIYASNHYYEMVQAPKTYSEFLHPSVNASSKAEYAVEISSVSKGERLIRMDTAVEAITAQQFIAVEGSGHFSQGNFKEELFELIDVMPNGQLRYLIYNHNGRLVNASPSSYGDAGKPAKCMWCHESYLLDNFMSTPNIKGYLNYEQFVSLNKRNNDKLIKYRKQLSTEINYENKKDHELAEIMYISYMEPSAETLAFEWHLGIEEIRRHLAKLRTHQHHEFPFLGQLYDRHEVDKLAPHKSVPIPKSIREPNDDEPNLLGAN
ncbi:hypothetical protein ACQKCH_14850 [Nubsella zeaxanthinifaciens]|uniref:hypothetical protein n=1 Tax=Nubsella zeaxanthinifaciens TaxID=392412 RepID=UPI003CFC6574